MFIMTLAVSTPLFAAIVYTTSIAGPYKQRTGHTGQCMHHAPALLAAQALIYSMHRVLVVWIIVAHFFLLCSLAPLLVF